jgi:hypothetical protein
MRIAFSGASGTGKTTLAKFVSEKYGIPINPVGSRSVAKAMGFDSPYDVDKSGKRAEFQRRLQAEKIEWELKHDSFVTDRTTLDELAYTILHDIETAIDPAYYDAATGHIQRYTVRFFLPRESFQSLGDDVARKSSSLYHGIFEDILWGLERRDLQSEMAWVLNTEQLERRQSQIAELLGRVHP